MYLLLLDPIRSTAFLIFLFLEFVFEVLHLSLIHGNRPPHSLINCI